MCVRIKPAYVIRFCSVLQLLRETVGWKDKERERESFTALSSSDLSRAHALITDTACQLDTRSISPRPLQPFPQANRVSVYGFIVSASIKRAPRVSVFMWLEWTFLYFEANLILCSSSLDCLIVSHSCAYVKNLSVVNCVVRRLDFTALLSAKEKCVLNSSINLLISPPIRHCQSQHMLSGEALCSLSVQSYGALMGNLKHIASTPQHM